MAAQSFSRAVWQVCIALVMGCGHGATSPESSLIRIEPLQTSYAPGDAVTLTLRNVSEVPVLYNACGSTLQQNRDGRWLSANAPEVACTAVIYTLAGGSTAVGWAGVLPPSLESGLYRYLVSALHGTTGENWPESVRASAPFLVTSR